MTQTHDDYYSNISSSSNKQPAEEKAKAKKIVVRKKKIVVKAKKTEATPEVAEAQKNTSEAINATETKEETLNDALNKKRVSRLKVVSQANPEKQQEAPQKTERKEGRQELETPQEKAAPKFKAGFSKQSNPVGAKKPSYNNDDNSGKKAKFYSG